VEVDSQAGTHHKNARNRGRLLLIRSQGLQRVSYSGVKRHPSSVPEVIQDASLADLLNRLKTSRDGLSTDEAKRRLTETGPNEFVERKLRSAGWEFLRGAANPLVIILLVAGTASAFLGQITDGAIIGGIVLMSAGINFWQSFRSERAVRELQEHRLESHKLLLRCEFL
jgi:magnesium-transporting ATPase (P-type)